MGAQINLWMVVEKNGTVVAKTTLPKKYLTHVKPYYGHLKISEIEADTPKLIYPPPIINADGKKTFQGRTLSKLINNRYYFLNGSTFETNPNYRGFDCTTFPMSLLSIPRIEKPGYDKQLCEAVGAEECGLEQIKQADLEQKFKENVIPNGLYIVFSAGHVLLYNSDINMLYEFNNPSPPGGFIKTDAGERKMLAPQGLWWIRRLDEKYRPCFK